MGKFSEFAIYKKFDLTQHHFPEMSKKVDSDQLTQLSSAVGLFKLRSEMELKSRLLPFSLIHIQC